MATLLSLSSSTLTSSFKGNARNLKANPFQFPLVKLNVKTSERKSRVLVVVSQASSLTAVAGSNVRFRLDNLGPQPGSRKKGKRKGRGHAAGQGGSCGFGMRGQKSRSGPGVRKGFEGGQMPLYRRIPKLRGIAGESDSWDYARDFFVEMSEEDEVIYGAMVSSYGQNMYIATVIIDRNAKSGFLRGARQVFQLLKERNVIIWTAIISAYSANGNGMHAGLPKYVPVNLKDIEAAGFKEGEEVSLESLKEKGLINPSGRERKLPLKILGDGELSVKLNFKARAFSAAAKEKLEATGCSLTILPGRKKWVKPSVAKNLARADEYFAKKKAEAPAAESSA
ncbi:Ribosomal protein L18e/L15P [Dillenia turbinata]|uniref:Ribosomal protein L18e/L15P n=1 Tax=Dillenia turbinata TaxID=194707 RepID=A0AAN8VQE0_9MAGN